MAEEKEVHQRKMQAQLDEWKAEADKLRAKAAQSAADARLTLDEKIQQLESKLREGEDKVRKLREAGEGAWEAIRQEANTTMESAKKSLHDLREKLKG